MQTQSEFPQEFLKSSEPGAEDLVSVRSSGLPMFGRTLLSGNLPEHTHPIGHKRTDLLASRVLVGTPQARKARYDPQFIRSIALAVIPASPPSSMVVWPETHHEWESNQYKNS